MSAGQHVSLILMMLCSWNWMKRLAPVIHYGNFVAKVSVYHCSTIIDFIWQGVLYWRWSRGETRKAEYVSLAASFLFHICVFCCNGSLSQCWWEHSCLSTWQPSSELSLPLIFVLLQLVVVTLLISLLAIIAQSKDAHVLWLTLIYYVVQSAYDWWFRVREWDT